MPGLDSFSALSLMDILQKIANAGATVIVTIHQPPPPVVRKIDKLLLLRSGQLLYNGPLSSDVEEYFAQRGFPKPLDYNIADWVMVSCIPKELLMCVHERDPFPNPCDYLCCY